MAALSGPSEYVIRVVSLKTGETVEWAPGLEVERDIEAELCGRVAAKGVGIGRTTAHVVEDVRTAFRELMHDLKSQV